VLREVWRYFNALRDYGASLRPQPGKNVHVKHTSQGIMLSADPGTSPGGEVAQFVIQSVDGDYLLCKRWDGSTLGAEEKVLKPYHLRRSPFDGESIVYVAEEITSGSPGTVANLNETLVYAYLSDTCRKVTRGSVSEYQVVIPFFTVCELIYAMKVSDTLVPNYPPFGEFTGDDEDLKTAWLDLNVDGRAWARQAP